MKNPFFPLLILLFLSAGSVLAQKPAELTVIHDKATIVTTAGLIQELKLTEQQEKSVTKIIQSFAKMRSKINNEPGSPNQKALSLAKIDTKEKENLKNLLTEDQYIKYLSLVKHRR